MADAYTRLSEPLEVSSPPETKRESAWWLIAVVVGWYLLAQIPAFVFAFTETITLRAMRTTAAAVPYVHILVTLLATFAGQCVYLLGSLVRGRIVGLGDLRAGLSFLHIEKSCFLRRRNWMYPNCHSRRIQHPAGDCGRTRSGGW